jgi:hypothetical protein
MRDFAIAKKPARDSAPRARAFRNIPPRFAKWRFRGAFHVSRRDFTAALNERSSNTHRLIIIMTISSALIWGAHARVSGRAHNDRVPAPRALAHVPRTLRSHTHEHEYGNNLENYLMTVLKYRHRTTRL